MTVSQDNQIVLKMAHAKFTCLSKTLDGIKETLNMVKIHGGFKDSMVRDINIAKEILNTSKQGASNE